MKSQQIFIFSKGFSSQNIKGKEKVIFSQHVLVLTILISRRENGHKRVNNTTNGLNNKKEVSCLYVLKTISV